MKHDRLVSSIVDLHRWVGDPFGLFATEAMRSIGLPVQDPPPEDEEVVEAAHEAVSLWLAAAAMEDPFADVLGPVYSEVASRGKRQRAGQFFTPWDLSVLIAELTLNAANWEPGPNPKDPEGLWRILEPACGSGAMLLAAFAELVRRHGPEPLRYWYAQAWDIDLTCARVCALQIMATLMMEGWTLGEIVIVRGDSLSLEPGSIVLHATAATPLPDALPAAVPVAPADGSAREPDIQLPDQLSLFDGEDAA